MRSKLCRIALVAATIFLALPLAALADNSSVWLVPGGGVVWPPAEWGVDDPVGAFGGIIGFRLGPSWAFELRGHYASGDSVKPYALGPDYKFLHGEGNLTLFLASGAGISPYLTAGAGAIRAEAGGNDESKFLWNAGLGFRIRLSDHISLRLDGRDISYKVPDPGTGEDELRHSVETFGGISFGFGGTPADEDKDGVPNKLDRCPLTPLGVRVDANGCPLDSDGDGVFDGIDKCEGTPAGARVDATGCTTDADGDGVVDGIDQCENTPNGCNVGANGCPMDSDQDGVCDGLDKCPETQATVRVDLNGCPIQVSIRETELLETGMIRLQDINFDTGKSTIKEESYRVLDEVGGILVRWPQLRIEIGGHTDSRGSNAYNQRLSDARAKAVLDYITSKFPDLKAEQYTAVGYGEMQPIATNSTRLGMAKNRRVEFKVLNKEALRKETQKQEFVPKE